MAVDPGKGIEQVEKYINQLKFGMLTTQAEDEELTSRPMTVSKVEGEDLWMFTKRSSGKIMSVKKEHHVGFSMMSPADSIYLSISGLAEVVDDREKIKALWDKGVEAFLPEGPMDQDVVLLKVRIQSAEYWDSSTSKMVKLFGMAKSLLKGEAYRPGEHERINRN